MTSKGNGFTAFNFERASSAKLVINVRGAGRERQEFCSETNLTQYCNVNTRLLVQRDNSLPGAVLANFAPLGASVVLLRAEVAPEGRLEP